MPESDNPGRILIADDDPGFRFTTQAFLRREGYECESATNASTAYELLKTGPFDLLISDIHMPGNNGLEFIRELPREFMGLPIILMTGNPTIDTAAQSVQLPVVGYLVKPAKSEELLRLVRSSISNYRAFRSLAVSRRKLLDWARELERLESSRNIAEQHPSLSPAASLASVTVKNLLSVLEDWKHLMQSIPEGGPTDLPERVELTRAVEETIRVLEKTRQSFKSRELATLRKKLEGVLDQGKGTP
ncbi:MAG: response regulator [Verrucomicrobiota bacterium]|nr:response regulator [Verrucomicrobiota bacterium]